MTIKNNFRLCISVLILFFLVVACQTKDKDKSYHIFPSMDYRNQKVEDLLNQLDWVFQELYFLDKQQKIKRFADFIRRDTDELPNDVFSDSLYYLMNEIVKEEQLSFTWLQDKKALDSYLSFPKDATRHFKYVQETQDVIIYQSRLLNVQEELLLSVYDKYRQEIRRNRHDYRVEYPFNQDFEAIISLNQSSFKQGDSLKVKIFLYANQYKKLDSSQALGFDINAKKYKGDTFYTIATLEDTIVYTYLYHQTKPVIYSVSPN